jgi:hypothetical protein
MNKAKICLLVIAVAAGLGGALAFKARSSNIVGEFNNTNTINGPENWIAQGARAQDQNDADYVPVVPGHYTCNTSSVVCLYKKVNGEWQQWVQGTFTTVP